jgi:hypothetical protein
MINKQWTVGWHDRDLGDYGIIDETGKLIAQIETGMGEDAFLMSASPELLALAIEVVKEYPDAADWKDAIGKLQRMARLAIAKTTYSLKEGKP